MRAISTTSENTNNIQQLLDEAEYDPHFLDHAKAKSSLWVLLSIQNNYLFKVNILTSESMLSSRLHLSVPQQIQDITGSLPDICSSSRPFPSSPRPLYQNDVKCSAFDVGMIFYST